MRLELSPLNQKLDRFERKKLARIYLYIGFGKASHEVYEKRLFMEVVKYFHKGIREFLIPSGSKNLWESLSKINEKFPEVKFIKTKKIPLKVLRELSEEFPFKGEFDDLL